MAAYAERTAVSYDGPQIVHLAKGPIIGAILIANAITAVACAILYALLK